MIMEEKAKSGRGLRAQHSASHLHEKWLRRKPGLCNVSWGVPYLPTVPIWSGQSRYYYLNPTSRLLALESPVCPEHSNCHTHFVYDACAHTTQALQSEAGLSGPRVRENPEIDSKVRRLARGRRCHSELVPPPFRYPPVPYH